MSGAAGEVSVLNVGEGDVKLSFDPANPQDCIRAARIVTDMLKRGYALLVDTGKKRAGRPIYQRALAFDAEKYEYIIADMDPLVAQAADAQEARDEEQGQASAQAGAAPRPQERETTAPVRRNGRRRIKATGAHAVAVSRTAGG